MTPDELRAVASRIQYRLAMLGGTRADGADMLNGPNAIDRLADVIEYCEDMVPAMDPNLRSLGRYSDGVIDGAATVLKIARGETNEGEKR